MIVDMEKKELLFNQLKGLIKLNEDTKELIVSSQNSLLPDINQWIQEAKKHIEQNNWLIDVIKKQLLRDYVFDLSKDELDLLNFLK